MITSRQKGLRFQDWVSKFLEKNMGYTVENFKPTGKKIRDKGGKEFWVSKRNDPFGCIDIIALKQNSPTKYIQATMHKSLKEKEKKFFEKDIWTPDVDHIEIWIKRESGQVDIYRMNYYYPDPYKSIPISYEFVPIAKIIKRKYYELKRGETI